MGILISKFMNVNEMRINLEIYLDHYIFLVVVRDHITCTGIVFHPVVTTSKSGLFTNLSTVLKSSENS